MTDLTQLFSSELLFVAGKGLLLFLIALYAIFSLIIFVNVRRLNDVVQIEHSAISLIVQGVFLLHLLLVVSLFLFGLAIL